MSTSLTADKATEVFIHYFALIGQNAGVEWGSDNDAEIRNAVDGLMATARLIAQEETGPAVRRLKEGLAEAEARIRRLEQLAHGHGGDA